MKARTLALCGSLLAAIMLGGTGCEDDGGSSGPATGLNVAGFWEGETPNGSTCAAPLAQNGANVEGEAKINRHGYLTGTLSGYHLSFTMTYDEGDKESGQGDFDSEGMKFTGNLPTVGDFYMLWRGPSFAEHSKLSEPLAYSK